MSNLSTTSDQPASSLPRDHSILSFLSLALAARRQRKALKSLNDTALADIGLTRDKADAEANRPFWDVPAHWRR